LSLKGIREVSLSIDFALRWTSMDDRFQRLNAARAQVIVDDEIRGGTPIIRGTRVPVYDVAASVAAGHPIERILTSYPSLSREQVELAALFAEVNPRQPIANLRRARPAGVEIISSRRKALPGRQ
jgi:uncharacterized protein (DUF433 family)